MDVHRKLERIHHERVKKKFISAVQKSDVKALLAQTQTHITQQLKWVPAG
jgi:hypothetical protein